MSKKKNQSDAALDVYQSCRKGCETAQLALSAGFEDAMSYGYERAFRPAEPAKFGHYLMLMRQAAEMFSETGATKRRQEHLPELKRREEEQHGKLQSWLEARLCRKHVPYQNGERKHRKGCDQRMGDRQRTSQHCALHLRFENNIEIEMPPAKSKLGTRC
ncbi:hypothetical protein HDU85_005653, partial [Gaertneriomyces sp. JEL0708]